MKAIRLTALSIVLLLITLLTGCSQEKSSVSEIAPVDKDKLKVISISYGNKFTKEFTDTEQINTLLGYLNDIKFSKMSIKQEEVVFDKGKIFNLDSTFSIQLMERTRGVSKADIILISEKELVLPDSETMAKGRTVSYINMNDDSSLNAVKEIYSLAFEYTMQEKLNNITHSKDKKVSLSSNPYDYIKDEESSKDYRYIVSQGEKSLNYMLNEFSKSNENGLKEYIMAIACSEILNESPDSQKWTSGREWYDNYTKMNK